MKMIIKMIKIVKVSGKFNNKKVKIRNIKKEAVIKKNKINIKKKRLPCEKTISPEAKCSYLILLYISEKLCIVKLSSSLKGSDFFMAK